MKITIPIDEAAADAYLPKNKLDGSGVGINYADAYLKPFKVTLEDGRKLLVKRRGIKITITIGEVKGEGLLRRLVHGPDPKVLLTEALKEAAAQAGVGIAIAPGAVELEVG
jgi:nitrogen fixation protein